MREPTWRWAGSPLRHGGRQLGGQEGIFVPGAHALASPPGCRALSVQLRSQRSTRQSGFGEFEGLARLDGTMVAWASTVSGSVRCTPCPGSALGRTPRTSGRYGPPAGGQLREVNTRADAVFYRSGLQVSRRALPDGEWLPRRGVVTVTLGAAIHPRKTDDRWHEAMRLAAARAHASNDAARPTPPRCAWSWRERHVPS